MIPALLIAVALVAATMLALGPGSGAQWVVAALVIAVNLGAAAAVIVHGRRRQRRRKAERAPRHGEA